MSDEEAKITTQTSVALNDLKEFTNELNFINNTAISILGVFRKNLHTGGG